MTSGKFENLQTTNLCCQMAATLLALILSILSFLIPSYLAIAIQSEHHHKKSHHDLHSDFLLLRFLVANFDRAYTLTVAALT